MKFPVTRFSRARLSRTLAIIVACGALTAGGTLLFTGNAPIAQARAFMPANPLLAMMPGDLMVGNADAPVTIIEYSSMSCPHCAAFHSGLYPELKRKYIDTGIVKFANRQYPLNEPALRAGMVALCAGKERGVAFTDVLFDTQDKWAFTPDFKENLKKIAAVGGMDSTTFDACMNNKALEDSLLQSRKEAADQLKVQATPTFFVNGTEVKGMLSVEMFDKAIADAQAAAGNP